MSNSNDHNEQHTSLPTFSSIHDQSARNVSYAESSKASSSRSAASKSQTRSQTRSDDGSRPKQSPVVKSDLDAQEEKSTGHIHGATRRIKRSSGGFLLDSPASSLRRPFSLVSSKSIKGKHKSENGSLTVPKTRGQLDGGSSRRSHGASSPLSFEVTAETQAEEMLSSVRDSKAANADVLQTGSLRSHQTGSPQPQTTTYGFDTDPTQIVEMALRLGEARKRQASTKRYASNVSEGRRLVSAATSTQARPSPPQDSLRSIRARKSMNPIPVTPQSDNTGRGNDLDERTPSTTQDTSPEQNQDVDEDMHISRATQKRVAKAKQYFELAYEHRRLLSHLPPLRTPGVQRNPNHSGHESKTYNPLQYARNRKLRFRERAAINSEKDGWHDVQKVRAWVDAVISSHAETKHDPRECVRLPPLTLVDEDAHDNETDTSTAARQPDSTARPRRPKSDWVTHPGDLIADAFWTEQGLNKQKIYNRDNEPIFPPGTKFFFSGWRNNTPLNVPDDLRRPTSSSETSPEIPRVQPVEAAPSLPNFESAHKDHAWARTRHRFSKAIKKGERSKPRADGDIFETSSESSDAGGKSGRPGRGRKRLAKKQEGFELAEGDPFAPPVQSSTQPNRADSGEVESSRQDAKREPRQEMADHANLLRYLRRNSTSRSAGSTELDKQKQRNFMQSLRVDADERGQSSFEYDSTAPGTPIENVFPSIAISLSPPASRSGSRARKGKGSFLEAVKDKVQPLRDRVDRTDFANSQGSAQSSKRGSIARGKKLSVDLSRGHSPMSRGTSPFSQQRERASAGESPMPSVEPRGSTISKLSSRTTDSATRSHRVRGMFKGGRIAEIVGNEVSRVGDFIWKRDPPRNRGTDSGSTSGYESDSEELSDERSASPTNLKRQERPALPRSQTVNETSPVSAVSRKSPKQSPQYYIQGLPSFTSPFQRDREAQEKRKGVESPGGTPQLDEGPGYASDPVSSAAAARRADRSPRFDRLKPPKLDIRAATPDGRRESYGFGAALDLTRTKSASQLFNQAIHSQPSGFPTSKRASSAAFTSAPDLSRQLSGQSERSAQRRKVAVHEIFRTRALLLATAIKANNIHAHCDAIPRPQSSFLYSAFEATGASGSEINAHLPARRREEHLVAARHLIAHLNKHSNTFNDLLTSFSSGTAQSLHQDVQMLEDKTESNLFPRLQALSNQAGQLAQKLTTTSTLAIKSVNEDVTEAMRVKRRGPWRFARDLGYKLIEVGVVSLLWVIWFVVTIIRCGVAAISALFAVLGWLFFWR